MDMCSASAEGLAKTEAYPARQAGQNMDDPFNLQRFVDAQQHVYAGVLSELKQGRKHGHWIWFIFPQLKGLGYSTNSAFFGIASLQEAGAYLQHPVLGARLEECTQLVNAIAGRSAEHIFGEIDATKFRSCMTLFAKATAENGTFMRALRTYFEGELDPITIRLLQLA